VAVPETIVLPDMLARLLRETVCREEEDVNTCVTRVLKKVVAQELRLEPGQLKRIGNTIVERTADGKLIIYEIMMAEEVG